MNHRRWKCKTCGGISNDNELLSAPNAFDNEQTLLACPHCKECGDTFVMICDEPGCKEMARCGWPTGNEFDKWDGYRVTCLKHSNKDESK